MKIIKSILVNVLIYCFFFVLLSFICFEKTSYDFLWSYGFSHAIKIGELPYVDFNTIVTPLYIFIMSIFLHIKDSFVFFIAIHSLFCTLFVRLLYKYIGKKSWIILMVLSFPSFASFIGTYNFLALLILVLLFYLEDENKSDYLIGFFIGLLILSKQTIGGVVLLCGFVILFDLGRIIRRSIGAFIPLLIFFLYLMLSKSLMAFCDLCFLGLFDFGSNNGGLKLTFLISIFMMIPIIIYSLNNKRVKASYVIGAFFFAFPIFDLFHFIMFLGIYILFIITEVDYSWEKLIPMSGIVILLILFFNFIIKIDFYKELVFFDSNHFKHYLIQRQDKYIFKKVIDKYNSYEGAIMIGSEAMLFDIVTNRKITFFDMPLMGNYGRDGTKGMIKRFNNIHNQIVFINYCHYEKLNKNSAQLDYDLIDYVVNNSKKIDSILCYNVYYKE